jgi:hypothetical protein
MRLEGQVLAFRFVCQQVEQASWPFYQPPNEFLCEGFVVAISGAKRVPQEFCTNRLLTLVFALPIIGLSETCDWCLR